MNTSGRVLRLTSFGESHGVAIGGILDGFPAGVALDLDAVQAALDRRKPGQSAIVTQRKESDKVVLLSGIFEGKSTGMPMAFQILNTNQRSRDYSEIADTFRPSHADWVYEQKYGLRDYRGGGRSSARETANWVVAGALAKQLLPTVSIVAYVHSVGAIAVDPEKDHLDFSQIEQNPVRCPNRERAEDMEEFIRKIKKEGDTVGGSIACQIRGVPVGLGEPIFDKLHARLAQLMMGINAAKAFEYGSGFAGCAMRGSEHNDVQRADGTTLTNHSGGILGGISNGMEINFRVGFKPVATLIQKQNQLHRNGEIREVQGKGRHDPCVVPRAVPIVEALAAFALADFLLIHKQQTIS